MTEQVVDQGDLVERLTKYVTPGARQANVDADFIGQCVAEAVALVNNLCGIATPIGWPYPSEGAHPAEPLVLDGRVPTEVLYRAYIEVGSELFHRRQAPSGISQFAAPDGSAMRVARDPMNAARAILAPYLPMGFA